MILVDTLVWVSHLRKQDSDLVAQLTRGRVLMHPFVLGELACGNLPNRRELLDLFRGLPIAPVATDDEAMGYIDAHELMGRGIGFIDVHLLASVALAETARIWTRDQRLAEVAFRTVLVLRAVLICLPNISGSDNLRRHVSVVLAPRPGGEWRQPARRLVLPQATPPLARALQLPQIGE